MIKAYKYPFSAQKKELLVYVDTNEHLILHALIMHETQDSLGHGFDNWLLGTVVSWYINEEKPKQSYKQALYRRSFLTPKEEKILLDTLQEGLLKKSFREERQKPVSLILPLLSRKIPNTL